MRTRRINGIISVFTAMEEMGSSLPLTHSILEKIYDLKISPKNKNTDRENTKQN